jgi:hypothetical protein
VAAALVLIVAGSMSVAAMHWTSILRYWHGDQIGQKDVQIDTPPRPDAIAQQALDEARQRTALLEAELKQHAVPGYGDPAEGVLQALRQSVAHLERELARP